MFKQLRVTNEHWLEVRRSLLKDTAILLDGVAPHSASQLNKRITEIAASEVSAQLLLLKTPFFLRLLNNLSGALVKVYDSVDSTPASQEGIKRAISASDDLCEFLSREDSQPDFPTSRWIRLVHGSSGEEFRTGREYGVEIDLDSDHHQQLGGLEAALHWLEMDSDAYDLVRNFVTYVVPLKRNDSHVNLSFSSRQFPNVVFKSDERSAILCGETLAHEADHQFFYALEEQISFWSDQTRAYRPAHYSPWRDDPRPLDGILRGLSAFTRVSQYYSKILGRCNESQLEQCGKLLSQRLAECSAADETIRTSGDLSDAGAAYVDELACARHEAQDSARGLASYASWCEESGKAVAIRRERWVNPAARFDEPNLDEPNLAQGRVT